MTQRMYFDIWDPLDPIGTALGELTEASNRKYRAADQAIGSGEFTINRHSPEAEWCVQRALVRIRLVTGGPFAYDDPRYVGAFYIETSNDVALSTDEEGGEELTRGGPTVVSMLKRAVNYPNANIEGHRGHWSEAKITGDIVFKNVTVGEAFRKLVLNAMQRTGRLEGLTMDATLTHDSSGTPWSETDTDWKFPVGMDLLTVLSKVVSSKTYYRMGPDLLLQIFEDHPGDDLSGSVVFTKAVDVTEVASKTIEADGFFSRVLVRGDKKDNQLVFVQVADTGVEAETGVVEGYVEYKSTPTTARLTKAGQQAIDKAKLRQDGPVTGGVYSTSEPFVDYREGDIVTVDIPGIYDMAEVRIAAVTLSELENGEYDVIHEYQAVPFDPATGPDNFASSNDAAPGPGGTPRGCGDCPQPGPFVPPTDGTTAADVTLSVGSVAFGYPSGLDGEGRADAEWDFLSEHGGVMPQLTNGLQYRVVYTVILNRPIPFDGNFPASGANANYGTMVSPSVGIGDGAEAGLDISAWTDPSTMLPDNPYPYAFPVVQHPNNQAGYQFATPWRIFAGTTGTDADPYIAGSAISGYWGYEWTVRAVLEVRNGDGSTIIGEGQSAPIQGQTVGETASDPPSSGIYTTNYPYVAGSLRVWVSGVQVQVTEVDNTAGTWRFASNFDPGTGHITVQYQALNGTPTGATNAPWSLGNTQIPGSLLPTVVDDKWKEPVRVATTANITIATGLNAGDTIDGETLAAGDRVLVWQQTAADENGIWVVDATPFRDLDMDAADEVSGAVVYVRDGSTYAGSLFVNTNVTDPDLGTDDITFSVFSPSVDVDAVLTTRGDLLTRDASALVRLPIGAAGTVLASDGTDPSWEAISTDPADDTAVWMSLTTVVGGEPELVWDGDDSLIPTLTPLS